MNLPSGHQTIMPYLILKGAAQFIDFTKKFSMQKILMNRFCAMTELYSMLKLS